MSDRMPDRPGATERRQSIRFPVVIPIEVKWREAGGKTVTHTGQAREVNAAGGLLDIKGYPGAGSEIDLTNLLSGETLRARVIGPRRSNRAGEPVAVAITLLNPSESFWGVNFQLRKTSADLATIEQAIKTGGIAPSILTEFRDAVDHVRRTAWAVQEWQERQLLKRDPQTVLPLITTERIRRATQLSKAITMDLAAHQVTRETAGIDELFRAAENLYRSVSGLFGEGKG